MSAPYYSLKTKTQEHCLEPLLDGSFYYAIYDLEENLTSEKTLVKKEDIIEFIYNKQKELNAKFEKKLVEETTKETVESKEQISERLKREFIFEDKPIGKMRHTVKASENDASSFIDIDKLAENSSVIVASVSDKGRVNIQVAMRPEANIEKSAEMTNFVIDRLLQDLIKHIPSIIQTYICSSYMVSRGGPDKFSQKDYDNFSDSFKESDTNLIIKKKILESIGEAITSDEFKIK